MLKRRRISTEIWIYKTQPYGAAGRGVHPSSEGSERNGSQKPKVDEASEEEKNPDEDNAVVGLGVKGSKG